MTYAETIKLKKEKEQKYQVYEVWTKTIKLETELEQMSMIGKMRFSNGAFKFQSKKDFHLTDHTLESLAQKLKEINKTEGY